MNTGRVFLAEYSKMKCIALAFPEFMAALRLVMLYYENITVWMAFAVLTLVVFALRILFLGFVERAMFEVNEAGVFRSDEDFLQWRDISHIELRYEDVGTRRKAVLSFRIKEERRDKRVGFSVMEDSYDRMYFRDWLLSSMSVDRTLLTIELLFGDIIEEYGIVVSRYGEVRGQRTFHSNLRIR